MSHLIWTQPTLWDGCISQELKIAMVARGRLTGFVKELFRFDSGIGAKVESGGVSFEDLEKYALSNGEPTLASGRQEMLENLINEFL